MCEWVDAAGDASLVTPQEIEDYVPFYAGPYGDLHLFARHRPGELFLFDHETGSAAVRAGRSPI